MRRLLVILIGVFLALATGIVTAAWYFFLTERGSEKAAVFFISKLPYDISWEKMTGTLWHGVSLHHITIGGLPELPETTIIKVQDVELYARAPSVEAIRAEFFNARLFLPGANPIMVSGSVTGRHIKANVFTPGLSFANIQELFPKIRQASLLKGSVGKTDLFVSGRWPGDLHVRGAVFVDQWRYENYLIREAPVRPDLTVYKEGGQWRLKGAVTIKRGTFIMPRTKIDIDESRLQFSGNPLEPEFDLKGRSKVARTRIQISLKGTRANPNLVLASDPSLPQAELLLMLTTGKKWRGLEQNTFQKDMRPEIAADFVDYLLFGGTGQKLANYLGLSRISFEATEDSQGITVNKELTDRLDVGYGVAVKTPAPNEGQRELKQKLQSEYNVTDNFSLGVEKEFRSTGQQNAENPLPTDDKVYFKFHKQF